MLGYLFYIDRLACFVLYTDAGVVLAGRLDSKIQPAVSRCRAWSRSDTVPIWLARPCCAPWNVGVGNQQLTPTIRPVALRGDPVKAILADGQDGKDAIADDGYRSHNPSVIRSLMLGARRFGKTLHPGTAGQM